MKQHVKTYFWLALLAHFLLLLSASLKLAFDEELPFEKKSDQYLPAYLYQESKSASSSAPSMPQSANPQQSRVEPEKNPLNKIVLKKVNEHENPVNQASRPFSRSAASYIQAESPNTGKPSDARLITELTRATSAKLYYPAEAAAFHIKGMVTVRFLLQPDGRVEEVSIDQSSGFHILDQAALKAIQSISPVRDANLYLTQPRYILAGIFYR